MMENRLQYMTWQEAGEAFKKTKIAIIPTGSTEQHGPHLPLGTDYLIAEYLAKRVAENIDVVVTPVIPIGYAHYHQGFTGTLSVNPEILTSYYQGIVDSLISYGITHFMFINGHGGNYTVLQNICRNLRIRGIAGAILQWFFIAGKLKKEWGEIFHGDIIETSLAMLISPESVKLDKAVIPVNKKVTEELQPLNGTTCRFKGATVNFYFMWSDISDSGNVIVYDRFPDADFSVSTKNASVQKGKEVADALVEYFVDFAKEFKKIKFEPTRI